MLNSARRFILRILQTKERSLEVVNVFGMDTDVDHDERKQIGVTLPELFAAAARCPNLREGFAPFSNVSLRAKQTLMLPGFKRGQSQDEIKFDDLFRGLLRAFSAAVC